MRPFLTPCLIVLGWVTVDLFPQFIPSKPFRVSTPAYPGSVDESCLGQNFLSLKRNQCINEHILMHVF